MARFNRPTATQRRSGAKTVNRAGGEAYTASPELALVSLLLTSFVKSQFYRSENEQMQEVRDLVGQVDHDFAAKAAVYARREFGMRSITHVLAADVAKVSKDGEASLRESDVQPNPTPFMRAFMASVIDRPDDALEIVAYYLARFGKPVPHSIKDGVARAISRLDSYQLAKYRGESRAVKMVDTVNLFHPKPGAEENAKALHDLVNGNLKLTQEGKGRTWEAAVSQAGKDKEKKAAAWGDQVMSGKMGYMALIRNLRNILQDAPDAWPEALRQVADPERVRRGRMFPFQYLVAIDAIKALPNRAGINQATKALETALEHAVANVPALPGRTLIAQDVSGSMQGRTLAGSSVPVSLAGGIFGAALYKQAEDADLMQFASVAQYVMYVSQSDSVHTIARKLATGSGGTNFHAIFQMANRAYDRVIILSDMQGWMGFNAPTGEFNQYCSRYAAEPHVYSFDLTGYGDLQFPERRVYALAGLSEKIFDVMKMLEEDREALVNRIRQVEFRPKSHHWETFEAPQGQTFEGRVE